MSKKYLGIIILLCTSLSMACCVIPLIAIEGPAVPNWLGYIFTALIFGVPAAWAVAGIVLIAKDKKRQRPIQIPFYRQASLYPAKSDRKHIKNKRYTNDKPLKKMLLFQGLDVYAVYLCEFFYFSGLFIVKTIEGIVSIFSIIQHNSQQVEFARK